MTVSEEKPYFHQNNKKIYAIHDFPHEIKNLVHALQNFGELYFGGLVLKMSDIINICQADKQCELSNNLGHIKEVHLNPNPFQKMRVAPAMQLLSKRMADTMLEGLSKGLVNSETMHNSALCILKLNALIDAGNSSNVYDPNPGKRPLSPENPEVIGVLEHFLEWGPTIQFFNKKRNKLQTLPCFIGLQMTI